MREERRMSVCLSALSRFYPLSTITSLLQTYRLPQSVTVIDTEVVLCNFGLKGKATTRKDCEEFSNSLSSLMQNALVFKCD